MIRAVLDTNLLISYLLTQGDTLSRIMAHWENNRFVYLISPQMLAELTGVINRPRLRRYMSANPLVLLETIESDAEHTAGKLILPNVCRDPKDDIFIACAVEGNAGYFVSGDADLLDLGSYKGVQMIRPWDFLQAAICTAIPILDWKRRINSRQQLQNRPTPV